MGDHTNSTSITGWRHRFIETQALRGRLSEIYEMRSSPSPALEAATWERGASEAFESQS